MNKLVFATNNQHKLDEVRAMIPQFEILSLADIGCTEDIPETAATFQGNAALKADYITKKYGLDCFSDDSGLEIEALKGAPGVFSARYAGEYGNHEKNIEKVLLKLNDKPNRNARFITVIALNWNGNKYFFEGTVNGKIRHEKSGSFGFGYDPIFQPDGYDSTFAEMSQVQKGSISHRGKAVEKLVSFLNNLNKKGCC
jgi:XTP/dITP diphosphohydrolase